ncbi:hypothetical protein [Pseudoalteromonas umbrosa]|uniref:hypothetical protein n=1 Tax=Pseudoalteromonas umbrosa TaxID=3048489 RepID=UPI0024C2CDCC|nr:hypothetical protein [Pseudoalteromonas sp. B95]MDK1288143.1 hypothetical protein [Pseudoalteromonas sp. B95]
MRKVAIVYKDKQTAKTHKDNGKIINIGRSFLGAFTDDDSLYVGFKAPLEQFAIALAKEIGSRGGHSQFSLLGPH